MLKYIALRILIAMPLVAVAVLVTRWLRANGIIGDAALEKLGWVVPLIAVFVAEMVALDLNRRRKG